jgi:hypothetical protein
MCVIIIKKFVKNVHLNPRYQSTNGANWHDVSGLGEPNSRGHSAFQSFLTKHASNNANSGFQRGCEYLVAQTDQYFPWLRRQYGSPRRPAENALGYTSSFGSAAAIWEDYVALSFVYS